MIEKQPPKKTEQKIWTGTNKRKYSNGQKAHEVLHIVSHQRSEKLKS
jgi:hypothetical protein